MKQSLIIILFLGSITLGIGQSFNIGVRAGVNASTFLGQVESVTGSDGTVYTEEAGFNNGFHFGISYQYNLVDNFGIRGELLYIQKGGQKRYTGPSYYVLRGADLVTFEPGTLTDYFLNVSIGYLSIPITAHAKLGSKFEVLGGIYGNINISPTANGRLRFDSTDDPDDIFFKQSLSYNYYNDEPLEANVNGGSTTVYVNDDPLLVARVANAYYQNTDKDGGAYKVLDVGLIGGLNYYFNRGFYCGARASYGLRDLTNDKMDVSLIEYNDDKTFITRSDKDNSFGLEFSLGFKF